MREIKDCRRTKPRKPANFKCGASTQRKKNSEKREYLTKEKEKKTTTKTTTKTKKKEEEEEEEKGSDNPKERYGSKLVKLRALTYVGGKNGAVSCLRQPTDGQRRNVFVLIKKLRGGRGCDLKCEGRPHCHRGSPTKLTVA
ncbi:hypothetical protein Ancab_033001 [Ancistrocladus abbreviatus]